MASSISKTVNINDLPVETDISSNDYIIIQNELKTYRVKLDMEYINNQVRLSQINLIKKLALL